MQMCLLTSQLQLNWCYRKEKNSIHCISDCMYYESQTLILGMLAYGKSSGASESAVAVFVSSLCTKIFQYNMTG